MSEEKRLVSVQPEILLYVDKADLKEMGYEDLVEMGRGVSEVKTYSQWILGKLGDAVAQKYGDLKKYADDIRQVYEAIQQYTNTYRKFVADDPDFTPDQYFGGVPWGVLQMVGSKTDKPVALLNELVDKGATTIPGAYREIKTKETGIEVPPRPRINFNFDGNSGKWKIKLRPEDLDLIDWTDVKQQLITYLETLT